MMAGWLRLRFGNILYPNMANNQISIIDILIFIKQFFMGTDWRQWVRVEVSLLQFHLLKF